VHFYAFLNHLYGALLSLYRYERTAQDLILSVRSLRFALCLKEHHRSQNESLLKSEERLSDFKENCAQLWKSILDKNKMWPFTRFKMIPCSKFSILEAFLPL